MIIGDVNNIFPIQQKDFCFVRILRGDRPYWWIHETAKWENVTLQQFELTCETGPGKLINLYQITDRAM